jgi:hypothetical protein
MTRRQILARWLSLENADGVARARRIRQALVAVSFVAFVVAFVIGVYFKVHPAATTVLGFIAGYLFAEAIALEHRLRMYPTYREYIDWAKVERDSRDAATS